MAKTERFKLAVVLTVGISLCFARSLQSQEYVIGPEDVLSISFWQQPDLNTTTKVKQDGKIVLPVIESITAAGLTPSQLGQKIVERISLYNRNITQASVVVTEYGSKKIYVTGDVRSPGKYTFEVIPNLWEVILEAGGPSATANLSNVTIIRSRGRTISVDLAEFLQQGDITKLPKLYPGDTIQIPAVALPTPGVTPGTAAPGVGAALAGRNAIYIYGQVGRPGVYTFDSNLDLLEALVLAGGPTAAANLDEVRIIMRGKTYPTVASVNLNRYATKGEIASFSLNPGDTIFVPAQRPSIWAGTAGSILGWIMRYSIAPLIYILVYSAIR